MSVEVKVPALGESIVEATVGRWLKREGENVSEGEALVELETDKVNMEVSALREGVLQRILKPEGENVEIGETLAIVEPGAAAPASDGESPQAQQSSAATQQTEPDSAQATPPAPTTESAEGNGEEVGRATPMARRMAAEHGVDLNAVKGTGPGGRVKRDDVAAFLSQSAPSQTAPEAAPAPSIPSRGLPEAPAIGPLGEGRREERVRLSRRRQTIARRLVEAQQTAAMLTSFNEVDMSAITEIRRRRRESFQEQHGVRLGFMSFFTRAVIGGLKQFPRLNAEIDGNEMVLKRYYDIGIAVSTDEGLVVPVIRDADRLSFADIEREVAALSQKARDGSLSLAELQGGTFTITNGGTFGSLLSTPILNAPQVGILGMHKIEERPVAVEGKVAIRPMMYVALSYDHRLVDGNEAVRYLVTVKELLEDPEKLLLEG